MDLYKLKTFKAVAAFLNFNQAAEYLNCAQSTVSGQIKSLEEEVGAPLFTRVNKRVKLTPAGEKMVAYAGRLLAIEQEAISDISGKLESSGLLTLRAPEAIIDTYFPELIERYLQRHPGGHLDISNCLEGSIENELQIDNIDLAFIFSDYLSSDNLNTEKLFTEQLQLVAHPDHPLTRSHNITPKDLQGEVLLFLKTGCGYGLPFRQLLNTHVTQPASIIEMTSVEAIRTCVKNKVGISLLPMTTIRQDIKKGKLTLLNWGEKLETTILMVWHKEKRMTTALECFIDLVRRLR